MRPTSIYSKTGLGKEAREGKGEGNTLQADRGGYDASKERERDRKHLSSDPNLSLISFGCHVYMLLPTHLQKFSSVPHWCRMSLVTSSAWYVLVENEFFILHPFIIYTKVLICASSLMFFLHFISNSLREVILLTFISGNVCYSVI